MKVNCSAAMLLSQFQICIHVHSFRPKRRPLGQSEGQKTGTQRLFHKNEHHKGTKFAWMKATGSGFSAYTFRTKKTTVYFRQLPFSFVLSIKGTKSIVS